MVQGEEENLFRLTLPTTQDMVIALDSDMENKDAGLQVETSGESYLDYKLEEKHSKESKPMVLVVEDNPEMLTFIERQLSF